MTGAPREEDIMKRHRAIQTCGLGLVLGAVLFAGCAGEQRKPQPSAQQIQEDSDRFFEQVRQEERERGGGSARPQ